jgi:hypothetical protein
MTTVKMLPRNSEMIDTYLNSAIRGAEIVALAWSVIAFYTTAAFYIINFVISS